MTKDTEIKNEKEKLSERINLRLTKSEYLKLKAKADEQNLTVNLFLRSKILEVAPPVNPIVLEKKVVKRVRDLPKIDPKMQKELNSIGVNINQIAKKVNTTGDLYPEEMQELKEMVKELWRILRSSQLK